MWSFRQSERGGGGKVSLAVKPVLSQYTRKRDPLISFTINPKP